MSRRGLSLSAPAYEILFTDSVVEVVEITPDRISPLDRHVPDPFRKRDKIPRNSGAFAVTHVTPEQAPTAEADTKRTKSQLADTAKSKIPQRKTYGANGIEVPIRQLRNISSESVYVIDGTDVDESNNVVVKNGDIAARQRQQHVKSRPTNKKRAISSDENSEQEERGVLRKQMKNQTKDINGAFNEIVAPTNKTRQKGKNKVAKTKTTDYHQMEMDETYMTYNRADSLNTPPATPPLSPPVTPTNKANSHANGSRPRKNSTAYQITFSGSSPSYTEITPIIPSTPLDNRPPPISTSPITISSLSESVDDVELSPTVELPPPKKPIIPHDEIIIPAVAKRLKKHGHFNKNMDNYSGVSRSSEYGYTDITDQVESLFDSPKKYTTYPRRQASQSGTKRQRQNSGSQIPVRANFQTVSQGGTRGKRQNTIGSPVSEIDNKSLTKSTSDVPVEDAMRSGRRSRREEWVMFVKDEDEEEEDSNEKSAQSTMTSDPSGRDFLGNETEKSQTRQTRPMNHNPKIVLTPAGSNERPLSLDLQSTSTLGNQADTEKSKKSKTKKDKRGKKPQNSDIVEDDGIVKPTKCCCIIC